MRAAAAMLLLSLLPGGCAPARPAPAPVETVAERGPLRWRVSLTPAEPLVGDAVRIVLEFVGPEDVAVEFPARDFLGDIELRVAEPTAFVRLPDGGRRWREVLECTVEESGAWEIPALAARYARVATSQAATQPAAAELVTQPLRLTVRSALTDADAVQTPRDVTGALSLGPRRLTAAEWVGLLAGVALVLGAAAYLARVMYRYLRRPAPPVAPEAWALAALGRLRPETAGSLAAARAMHYELTEIVRVYIERKFGVAAPELTTEEFLALLQRDAAALPYDQRRLGDLLAACDLVKYAAVLPSVAQAAAALDTARAFVRETAAAAGRAPAPDAAGPPLRGAAA